jgi:hypothetical protein
LARPGAFKSEKRKKELNRLKKQEEKRQKRLHKNVHGEQSGENIDVEGNEVTDSGNEEKASE